MKRKVMQHIRQLGGKASYSVRTKTIYIDENHNNVMNPSASLLVQAVFEKFGKNLPFKLTH